MFSTSEKICLLVFSLVLYFLSSLIFSSSFLKTFLIAFEELPSLLNKVNKKLDNKINFLHNDIF